jgi:uncharacterized NAD(P)/FAD-binding protein YdhS
MQAESSDVDVAIVGAGFCGAMLAVHLAREPSIRIALFERAEFARGVAYSTENPRHVLNLTAAKMSPFPDQPADFVEWLAGPDSGTYVPRARYAGYLRAVFDGATQAAAQIRRYRDGVVSVDRRANGFLVSTEGDSISARCVVLALGNFAPGQDFIPGAIRRDPRYVRDPWAVPFDQLSGDVLVVGNGLTAIDVVLELEHRGYGGEVVMLSRHGRAPQRHKEYGANIEVPLDKRSPLSILRSVRQAVAATEKNGGDWRAVVDGIRPLTQGIWQSWPLREQERFLRHLRIFWETSRRRVPPDVAAAVSAFESTGRLTRTSGRIATIDKAGDGRFRIAVAGSGRTTTFEVDWIVNCTGPQVDVAKLDEALIRSLLAGGLVAPHPTRMGIQARPDGRVVDAHGVAQDDLFVLGGLLRGVLYETTSVPELSLQVQALAQKLVALLVPPQTAAARPNCP